MNAHAAFLKDQTEPAVRVTDLVRSFGHGSNVLDGLNLSIRAGEFVALLGRSGSGKSTLLRTLAGLDEAPSGTVSVPTKRSVVFQEPRLVPWKRVWANVALGLPGSDTRQRAIDALREVGLSHRLDAWPLTLSGGEAQRVALARSLVREPDLLLLDEPFAALDALTRLKTQRLVAALWRAHRPAVLLVTHDVDEALSLADRVLVLSDGLITLDLPVTLERPRRQAHPRFAALRSILLRELGVEEDDATTIIGLEERAPDTITDFRPSPTGIRQASSAPAIANHTSIGQLENRRSL